MFKRNRIAEMLENKQVPLGMQVFTGHPALIEILGLTGFDFVMLDTEHSPNNARDMEHLVRAADTVGLATFVRVSKHDDESDIHRALEAGAVGIFLPLIKTAEDVKRAADAAYFPMKGKRGICPSLRAARYNWNTFDEYARWNNDEVMLVPMIEQVEAVENIEEICALEDVKMIVFAAGDLAYAMGEASLMMDSPKVQAAYRKVLDAAKRHNVAVNGGPILDATPESCRKALDSGVSVFTLGLDTLAFRRFCEDTVGALNTGIEGSDFTRPPAPISGFKAKKA
ncbi:HpcH/HpaI aldolase family protein [Govanella unica]|uniref:Aldolase/citrate lyase family protein n=1 Tax=Govanella unica TaxID=2975056 RepID=A0A9X3Z7R1_9PROT|nr:aldolase/citrate lyase family protein [Govania unica]MDA5194447.1 aldolase/citrate lyase family protein [Govania unica]